MVKTTRTMRRMELDLLVTPGLGDNSYVVSWGDEAAVIDPQRDVGRFVEAAAERGARIRHVVETHVHNDYVSGAAELLAGAGQLLRHDLKRILYVTQFLSDRSGLEDAFLVFPLHALDGFAVRLQLGFCQARRTPPLLHRLRQRFKAAAQILQRPAGLIDLLCFAAAFGRDFLQFANDLIPAARHPFGQLRQPQVVDFDLMLPLLQVADFVP